MEERRSDGVADPELSSEPRLNLSKKLGVSVLKDPVGVAPRDLQDGKCKVMTRIFLLPVSQLQIQFFHISSQISQAKFEASQSWPIGDQQQEVFQCGFVDLGLD